MTLMDSIPEFSFDRGSIVIPRSEWNNSVEELVGASFKLDARTGEYRALAMDYGPVILALHRKKVPHRDSVKAFGPISSVFQKKVLPRPYQSEALEAWKAGGSRACVTLPTGSGKTFLALLAMEHICRNTLILVPTLDLMNQWAKVIEEAFCVKVGLLGGGEREILPITISTYDSARIHMEYIGNSFGFLIADECHHLPSPGYQWCAKMCIAPFRLGLSATPERSDGGEQILQHLMGPIVYTAHIHALKGEYLSEYSTHQLEIPLEEKELEEYHRCKGIFSSYAQQEGVNFSDGPQAWQQFIGQCFLSPEGREAYAAWRRQKEIMRSSSSKLATLWKLLRKHRNDRVIIFTDDNATAYKIAELFLLPVITHQTKIKERKVFLHQFKKGEFPFLVTSKVLNEGVDVPEANVGIIVSGSGSVREHVQRLGRILRKSGDGQALLYELISQGTSEFYQSKRRRQHQAYQK